MSAPSAPVITALNGVVFNAARTEATIKFTAVNSTAENVTSYVIQSSPALTIDTSSIVPSNTEITFVVTGLSASVSYIFRVGAVNANGTTYSAYSAPQPIPVEVNLNVEIAADGELNLLSQQLQTPLNVVCATEKLPAEALYKPGTHALIEFWEDAAVDGIKAKLASDGSYNGYYLLSAKALAKGLQLVLCGEMHANKTVTRMDGTSTTFAASPFIGTKYGANGATGAVIDEHKIFNHFGRMALACYAHYLMGHQQATAAITNDKAFMAKMLSLDFTGVSDNGEALLAAVGTDAATKSAAAAALYAKYDAAGLIDTPDARTWPLAAPAANANADLARRLVAKLLDANLGAGSGNARAPVESTVNNASDVDATSGSAADIVDQVIGRDASRARGEDNSAYLPNNHGLLRFYAGDVVYVNIKLVKPTVSVSSTLVAGATIANQYSTEENYTIRIVLA